MKADEQSILVVAGRCGAVPNQEQERTPPCSVLARDERNQANRDTGGEELYDFHFSNDFTSTD
jgi:hypothetical protein